MLTEPTLDRLRALRLGAMADAYCAQQQDPAIGTLSFEERVGLLVEAEHLSRDNRKLARRLTEAKLRITQACLEDLEYAPRRELDRPLIRQLATGRWIGEHRNVLITGATGVGKTYLACALGQQAWWARPRVHGAVSVHGPGHALSLRREGPLSVIGYALWTRRSRTASAIVGSPRYACH